MQYRPELDGLRAIAALLVVAFHAGGPLDGGFVGVDLFFVLSGFLITSLLARDFREHGHIRLGSFYWRRFLRLMPPLLVLVAAYLVFAPLIWPRGHHLTEALLTVFYLSDYAFPFLGLPQYLQHSWSLAVEEHYYLLWPLILPFLLRSKRPVVWLASAWAIFTIWRTSYLGELSAFYRFDTRSTGLILGSLLYFATLEGSKLIGTLGLITLAVVSAGTSFWSYNIAIPIAEIASAAVVVSAASVPTLRNASLVWLGKLSYGLYLWQYPVAILTVGMPFLPRLAVIFSLSVMLAAASYYSLEAWVRRLRDRPVKDTMPPQMPVAVDAFAPDPIHSARTG